MSQRPPRLINANGLFLWPVEAGIPDGFTIAFSTRTTLAGDAPGFINYGLSGDIPAGAEARRLLCEALNISFDKLTLGKQVHGVNVETVTPELAGRGRRDPDDRIHDTDALITGEEDIPLAVVTADCLPVLLAAPGCSAAAVHAGWRGLFSGIVENTVRKMTAENGADVSEMKAYVGPSIGPCCFEVGSDVCGMLGGDFRDCMEERAGSVFVNLWEICRCRLETLGLRPENIYVARVCTCCRGDLFFSYRGARVNNGSNISIIARSGVAGMI